MNPGLLNRKIVFQKFETVMDPDGFETKEWTDFKTVYAQPKTTGGQEIAAASSEENIRTTRWIIRYTSGLAEDMRIRYGTRFFSITAILQDDERRKTLTVLSQEVVDRAAGP